MPKTHIFILLMLPLFCIEAYFDGKKAQKLDDINLKLKCLDQISEQQMRADMKRLFVRLDGALSEKMQLYVGAKIYECMNTQQEGK